MADSSKTVLIVGGTRGLGLELAKKYHARGDKVYATARSSEHKTDPHDTSTAGINWLTNIDVAAENAGPAIVAQLPANTQLDITIISAGYFGKESFSAPDWSAELLMYKTSAMGPVFITHALASANLLPPNSRLALISSEAGSIGLRHASEGGGMYGHHASKAALNMAGRLLALDLAERRVAVALLHPGFMRTQMTASVGFDKFWDQGGAVRPEEAAASVVQFVDGFGVEASGSFWAPRGAADIGTAEATMGPREGSSTPLQLPW